MKHELTNGKKSSAIINAENGFEQKKTEELFFPPKEGRQGFFNAKPSLFVSVNSSNTNPVIQKKELPFPPDVQDKMESVFDEDFSTVKIQKDSQQALRLNALAYTQGEEIHFAPGQYNARSTEGQQLIGHELAHVSQQRSGVVTPTVLAKGMDINNDKGLEQQADEMGKKAAVASVGSTYRSKALNIRNNLRTIQMAKKGVVQLASFPTFYGEFKDKTYKAVKKEGVDIELEFHPGPVVNAKKIGMTQIVRSKLGGKSIVIHPTQESRMVDRGFAEGSRIDNLSSYYNPLYAADMPSPGDTLKDTPTVAGWGQHGWKYTDGAGIEQKQIAILKDKPALPGHGKDAGQYFETTALAVEGAQEGTYYGSVSWGWETDASGKFAVLPIEVRSKSAPTEHFLKGAEKWNAATVLGTIKTIADPTNVYNNSFNKKFTVPKDEVVTIQGAVINKNIVYQNVTIVTTGKTGRIKTGDLKDQGDGNSTIDLPIVAEIYAGPFDSIFDIAPLAQVTKDTKVKVLDDSDSITAQVEVMEGSFIGTRGYVNKLGGLPFKNTVK